jgi:type I restriction enzyme, S subunit
MTWPRIKLDTIKVKARYALVGGPFGSNLTTRDYVDEGVPVIRGNNLPSDSVFFDDDFVFVAERKADDLVANTAYPGDVIFTQRGTLGQVGVIPLEAKFPRYIISQSQMKLSVDPEKAAARFIYYFFRMPGTVQVVLNHALASGVPHINLGILKEFQIPLPPVPVQGRIVDILSAYDDLIENNRRRMALLAETARQLYREWFVRLRFPGHEHTRITNGVPEGWERKKLGDVLTLTRGYDLPEADRVPGDIPIVSSSGITGFHNVKKADPPGVVTGRYGTLGEVYSIDREYWPLNTALYVSDFKGNRAGFVAHFLREALQRIRSDKVAVPGLNRNVAHALTVLFPSKALRDRFNDLTELTIRQVSVLGAANEKLRAARDLLLPRLMSAEIAV